MDDIIRGRLNITDGPEVVRVAAAMRAQSGFRVTHVATSSRPSTSASRTSPPHSASRTSSPRWPAPRLLLGQAWARGPDDDHVLVPTGDMYSSDESGRSWSIAFTCPEHPDELLRIWQPGLQPLIDEVLAGVDIASLPFVDRPC